ncbi:MAG: indole-3-glycerol phosphate synthase TrpC [Fimbriiglobus sp.]
MANILDQIVATKWQEIAAAKAARPWDALRAKAEKATPRRGFRLSLHAANEMAVIAEVKRASPSAGEIRADFDPLFIAETYSRHGATCLSVLTDEVYFRGHLDYLRMIRANVRIPLLRKEFILDEYQLDEALEAGADAVLLIAEILPGARLKELYNAAIARGLDVLIELHDAHELTRVLGTGTQLLGINNRDLRSFETRLEHTLDLLPKIPKDVLVVSESGIKTHADMVQLHSAGVRAVLVGESLMRAPDIGLALEVLRGQRLPE